MAFASLAWYAHARCFTISEVLWPGLAVARPGRLLFAGHGSPRPIRILRCAGVRARLEPIENVAHAITDKPFRYADKFRAVAARSTDLQELHADAEPRSNSLVE